MENEDEQRDEWVAIGFLRIETCKHAAPAADDAPMEQEEGS